MRTASRVAAEFQTKFETEYYGSCGAVLIKIKSEDGNSLEEVTASSACETEAWRVPEVHKRNEHTNQVCRQFGLVIGLRLYLLDFILRHAIDC